MTEKLAKGIVRKYGKGKDYLTAEDCARIINRRNAKAFPNRKGPTPKKPTTTTSTRRL